MYTIHINCNNKREKFREASFTVASAEQATSGTQELIKNLRPFGWWLETAATIYTEHEEFSHYILRRKNTQSALIINIHPTK